jgi:hypothetical protein
MTVRQLIEALSEHPGDAIVDVWIDPYRFEGCRSLNVVGIDEVTVITTGPNKGTWVTLELEA